MNWKNLIWIIPLILIIGLIMGYRLGIISLQLLTDMTQSMDKCSMRTLEYAIDKN